MNEPIFVIVAFKQNFGNFETRELQILHKWRENLISGIKCARVGSALTKAIGMEWFNLSNSLISQLPATLHVNPNYRDGPPMKLYHIVDLYAIRHFVYGSETEMNEYFQKKRLKQDKLRLQKHNMREERKNKLIIELQEQGMEHTAEDLDVYCKPYLSTGEGGLQGAIDALKLKYAVKKNESDGGEEDEGM